MVAQLQAEKTDYFMQMVPMENNMVSCAIPGITYDIPKYLIGKQVRW